MRRDEDVPQAVKAQSGPRVVNLHFRTVHTLEDMESGVINDADAGLTVHYEVDFPSVRLDITNTENNESVHLDIVVAER